MRQHNGALRYQGHRVSRSGIGRNRGPLCELCGRPACEPCRLIGSVGRIRGISGLSVHIYKGRHIGLGTHQRGAYGLQKIDVSLAFGFANAGKDFHRSKKYLGSAGAIVRGYLADQVRYPWQLLEQRLSVLCHSGYRRL